MCMKHLLELTKKFTSELFFEEKKNHGFYIKYKEKNRKRQTIM
jgi:hypothetical protein